jgi:UDP-glucose 4-epimerase
VRILVVGGAGFVGSTLCQSLQTRNPSLIVIADNFFLGHTNNLKELSTDSNVLLERIDLSDTSTAINLQKKYSFEEIWNLAVVPLPTSLEYPSWTIRNNVEVAISLAETMRLFPEVKLINISSSEVYGTADQIPMSENHRINPLTAYAASKVSTDAIFSSYKESFGLDIETFRPFNMFGPRQNVLSYAGVIPKFILNIFNEIPLEISGDGSQTRDFTFVSEATATMVKVASSDCNFSGALNIGTGFETSVLQIAQMVKEVMGKNHHPITFTEKRKGDVMRHKADVTKLTQLGFAVPAPISLEQIERTVSYYASQIENFN